MKGMTPKKEMPMKGVIHCITCRDIIQGLAMDFSAQYVRMNFAFFTNPPIIILKIYAFQAHKALKPYQSENSRSTGSYFL